MATIFPNDWVIVLGGGLGGMAAANTVLEHGAKCVLLDKSAFCGGNSTKATSGINGAATKTQKAQGVDDSVELFSSDCLKGGAKKPELVKVLATNSGPDVDWLCDIFGLDLSLLARLGGHSAPRTHRGKERFPGMTITYALIQMFEKCSENSDCARVVTKAKAEKLLRNAQGAVVGCEYVKGGQTFQEHGPVIIATGGFGADFSQDSLLAKYRPDLMHLPTSNGEHCTGDGIKMGEAIGARTLDLEWVQVHPTGLVNPKDVDAKVKFLAAEALRGVGGLVFDANGKRFANELGRRDYVTGEMWKNKAPFRLCLNKAASDEIIWHCKHYTGRGVMKYFESGKALAAEIGCSAETMATEIETHAIAADKQAKDPEGGPFPGYPSGKTWDEASGKTGSGKKFFHNVLRGSQFASEPYYAAIITPIIHYCMGGLEITTKSEVVGANGRPIPGLYCAGECMGGVHGNNRLGGNSLLDCVVFGRVAGKACAQYMLGNRMKDTKLADLAKSTGTGGTAKSALSGGSYEDEPGNPSGATAVTTAAAGGGGGAAKPAAATGGAKSITLEEVAKHSTEQDCWVAVNGDVLDVTAFLPDHPGGVLAIVTFAGKDASEEFNMIHPPDVISKYAPEAVIGKLGDGKEAAPAAAAAAGGAAPAAGGAAAAAGSKNDLGAPLISGKGDKMMEEHAWGRWREEAVNENPGVLIINVQAYFHAALSMVNAFLYDVCATIFMNENFKFQFTNHRSGLSRSAVFLMMFMVIHAVGNLHVFLGPDDFNGYGYVYTRLYWTGLGLPANIVEEYVIVSVLLHVAVALKRTWDINRNYTMGSGKLNLAITGVVLLTFMCIHLVQFRFGATQPYLVRPPRYFVNFSPSDWIHLRLFWSTDTTITPVPVRDIYKLEFDLFSPGNELWIVYYLFNVGIFLTHVLLGWAKLVGSTAFHIPKAHQARVVNIGNIIFSFIAFCYFAFPTYCYFVGMSPGALGQV